MTDNNIKKLRIVTAVKASAWTVIVMIVLAVGYNIGRLPKDCTDDKAVHHKYVDAYMAEKAIDKAKQKEVIINPEIIGSEMKNVAKLTLLEESYKEVVSMEDYRQLGDWNVLGTKKSALLEAKVTVEVGFDLSDVKESDVEVTGDKLYLTVKEPEILAVYSDPDSVYVYDESHNIFNQISTGDTAAMLSEAEKKAEEEAGDDELIDIVKADFGKRMEKFVKNLYPDADIEVKVIWK